MRRLTARPRLETERLVLVPQTRAALSALLAGDDTGLSFVEGYPHADSIDAARMQLEHGNEDNGGWFVTLADDGRVLGDCGTFGPPNDEGRVEIGFGLAESFRGRGIGTEAVRALVGWLASRPEVRVVVAAVEVGNEASRRLLVGLGFTLVREHDRHWYLEHPV